MVVMMMMEPSPTYAIDATEQLQRFSALTRFLGNVSLIYHFPSIVERRKLLFSSSVDPMTQLNCQFLGFS